jgi:homoaconitase/3-isopropylmalate dehydratase large subunit
MTLFCQEFRHEVRQGTRAFGVAFSFHLGGSEIMFVVHLGGSEIMFVERMRVVCEGRKNKTV